MILKLITDADAKAFVSLSCYMVTWLVICVRWMQARPLLVDALETDDFRELADPALERRYSKSEMRRMVEAAAACIRYSVTKRPRMVQVIKLKSSLKGRIYRF